MEDDSRRARLVDEASFEGRGISTTLPRSELEEAIGSTDGPLKLELDIRAGDDERRVGVAWDREDLERVLGRTSGDSVVFTFDREELAGAIAGDVEAHGLRQRAAVLAVAAAAATGSFAGAAAAGPVGDPGPSSTSGTAQFSQHAQLPPSSGDDSLISAPSPETAAGITAGIAIMIAGASFVAAGRQGRTIRPA
jgi:hypothetical protein